MAFQVKVPAKHAELHAVITRADGTVEDLGCIAYYDKNPLKRWVFAVRNRLNRK